MYPAHHAADITKVLLLITAAVGLVVGTVLLVLIAWRHAQRQ